MAREKRKEMTTERTESPLEILVALDPHPAARAAGEDLNMIDAGHLPDEILQPLPRGVERQLRVTESAGSKSQTNPPPRREGAGKVVRTFPIGM